MGDGLSRFLWLLAGGDLRATASVILLVFDLPLYTIDSLGDSGYHIGAGSCLEILYIPRGHLCHKSVRTGREIIVSFDSQGVFGDLVFATGLNERVLFGVGLRISLLRAALRPVAHA